MTWKATFLAGTVFFSSVHSTAAARDSMDFEDEADQAHMAAIRAHDASRANGTQAAAGDAGWVWMNDQRTCPMSTCNKLNCEGKVFQWPRMMSSGHQLAQAQSTVETTLTGCEWGEWKDLRNRSSGQPYPQENGNSTECEHFNTAWSESTLAAEHYHLIDSNLPSYSVRGEEWNFPVAGTDYWVSKFPPKMNYGYCWERCFVSVSGRHSVNKFNVLRYLEGDDAVCRPWSGEPLISAS
jgi:hypothetical protein